MPDPTRLLNTIQRAGTTFRATPGRRGRFVELQECDEVLVAGDLHGNLANFRVVFQKADLGNHPRRHLVLQELIHSDFAYPTGGDKSHQLLDVVAALKRQFPNQVHYLMGNHELAQATGRRVGKGDMDYNEYFREGVLNAYGTMGESIYAAYEELFRVIPVALRTPNRVYLSHSLPPAKRMATFFPHVLEQDEPAQKELIPQGTIHSLVWGRDTSLANITTFLEKVDADLLISGHIPCDDGFDAPNEKQLIVDCHSAPATYCLFPTDRPLTHADLLTYINFV